MLIVFYQKLKFSFIQGVDGMRGDKGEPGNRGKDVCLKKLPLKPKSS